MNQVESLHFCCLLSLLLHLMFLFMLGLSGGLAGSSGAGQRPLAMWVSLGDGESSVAAGKALAQAVSSRLRALPDFKRIAVSENREISETGSDGMGDAADTVTGEGSPAGSVDGAGTAWSGNGSGEAGVFNEYLALLRKKLQSHRYYPYAAQRLGIEGTVYLRFHVNADGRISAAGLAREASMPLLAQAALKTLRNAEPLPPPPREIGEHVQIEVPLVYQLNPFTNKGGEEP